MKPSPSLEKPANVAPIMPSVIQHARRGGLVLGICNGFQILTECHLLPGALLRNINIHFKCSNAFVKCDNNETPFTTLLQQGEVLQIPIAHADGRFFADENIIKSLEDNQQVVFRYCDVAGNITEESNPNGSVNNIAGICNAEKNILGLMPHPERAWDNYLGNIDGRRILESILNQALM